MSPRSPARPVARLFPHERLPADDVRVDVPKRAANASRPRVLERQAGQVGEEAKSGPVRRQSGESASARKSSLPKSRRGARQTPAAPASRAAHCPWLDRPRCPDRPWRRTPCTAAHRRPPPEIERQRRRARNRSTNPDSWDGWPARVHCSWLRRQTSTTSCSPSASRTSRIVAVSVGSRGVATHGHSPATTDVVQRHAEHYPPAPECSGLTSL